jgi:hypothetical protein
MQGLEVRYKQAAEEACMEGELSRQRAAAAELEAREAREREVLQSKAAEVGMRGPAPSLRIGAEESRAGCCALLGREGGAMLGSRCYLRSMPNRAEL